ncbi:MAG: hypothetical protein QXD43_01420 [Candidatus Aenigmatarchaeota archaeon]
MAIDIAFLESEQILIPFLFVLAVVFGILEITKIFRNRGVNFLIALSIAFFTVTNISFVNMLWSYFGSITTFFIIMFFIAFTFEVFGLRKGQHPPTSSILIDGAILFLLLSIGFVYANKIPELPFLGSGQNLIFLFIIVFILVIFWSTFKIGAK